MKEKKPSQMQGVHHGSYGIIIPTVLFLVIKTLPIQLHSNELLLTI
jgi:hypothetical protein